MIKYLPYAGIGSRETPENLIPQIHSLVNRLECMGFTLRSGAAPGADTFFENGIVSDKNKEIYLPWKNFNANDSTLYDLNDFSKDIAVQYHPNIYALSPGAFKLMQRNTYQVLGMDGTEPSKFIVCWTKNGQNIGGTSQALRIASAHSIPIFNLYYTNALNRAIEYAERLI